MDQTATREAAFAKHSTTLRFRRRIPAAPSRVFQAWTRPEALKLWWCPDGWLPAEMVVDLRMGGAYRIAMRKDRGGLKTVSVHGRFIEVVPGVRLVYTWRWEGILPDIPETQVTVEFRDIDGETELVLIQEDLPLPLCTLHLGGWLEAIDRMERLFA